MLNGPELCPFRSHAHSFMPCGKGWNRAPGACNNRSFQMGGSQGVPLQSGAISENHGMWGQFGATRITAAFSSRILRKRGWRRLKGGKAYSRLWGHCLSGQWLPSVPSDGDTASSSPLCWGKSGGGGPLWPLSTVWSGELMPYWSPGSSPGTEWPVIQFALFYVYMQPQILDVQQQPANMVTAHLLCLGTYQPVIQIIEDPEAPSTERSEDCVHAPCECVG